MDHPAGDLEASAPRAEPNSRRELSAEEAAREAEIRIQSIRETVDALHERFDDQRERVEVAVGRAREGVEQARAFVREHRWAAIAGAVVFGIVMGSRGARRRARRMPLLLDSGEQRVTLVMQPPKKAVLKSALSGLGGLIARTLASACMNAAQDWYEGRMARLEEERGEPRAGLERDRPSSRG